MQYRRMPIEIESPEQLGYDSIAYNLAESSVTDAVFGDLQLDLNKLVVCYGHHLGKPELRDLLLLGYSGLTAESVLLTAGAAAGLFIVNTSLLSAKDHLMVVRPNYATNIETPRAIGCEISFVDLAFEDGFRFDLGQLKKCIQANTRLISITTPHNPTGVMLSETELRQIGELAEEQKCYVLVDETYRDLAFGPKPPLAASLSNRFISVSSVSKAYGIPGVRLGWIITTDPGLQELFLAAKEQIYICNSVVDEEITYQFLQNKNRYFEKIKKQVEQNFAYLKSRMLDQQELEWVEPKGGVVCFPRLNPKIDPEKFYSILNSKYKTRVGPGHWFEMEKRYFRLGFGWERVAKFETGLDNIFKSAVESR